jgi:hypothetical protein
MKMYRMKFLWLLVFAFIISSCEEEQPTLDCTPNTRTEVTLNILTLGDSRVEGFRGEFESYRYELWKTLIENNWDVDFMGSRKDEGTYPPLMEICFDNDHEGTGGATTTSLFETLESVSFDYVPDVALLGIGGNDLLDEMQPVDVVINNINTIIDKVQSLNPNVVIILEQIAPGRSDIMSAEFTAIFNAFNEQVLTVLDTQEQDAQIVIVNMAEGWSDNYMADQVHYNEAGAKVVADRYYQVIVENVQQ